MQYVTTSVENPKMVSSKVEPWMKAMNSHLAEMAADDWELHSTISSGGGMAAEVVFFIWQRTDTRTTL
ncbi:MAG: hypothetical protein QOE09_3070 [Ilumatobacteraceae bacterium]